MECVPLSEFLYTNPIRSASFDAKAAMLMSGQYKCFLVPSTTVRDGGGARDRDRDINGQRHKEKEQNNRWQKRADVPIQEVERNRPFKLNTEDTHEGQARKAFLPLMNKLTLKNKVSIFTQVSKIIEESCIKQYCNILWDISLSSPTYQAIYIEVFDLIMNIDQSIAPSAVKAYLSERLTGYIKNKEYLPPDSMDRAEYDEFCEYVSWKKRSVATVSLLVSFEKKGYVHAIEPLTSELLETAGALLSKSDYEKSDVIIDQILEMYTQCKTVCGLVSAEFALCDIKTFVAQWSPCIGDMKASTKFKFYTFSDLMVKKAPVVNPIPIVNKWTVERKKF